MALARGLSPAAIERPILYERYQPVPLKLVASGRINVVYGRTMDISRVRGHDPFSYQNQINLRR